MGEQNLAGYPPRGYSGHNIKDLQVAKLIPNQSKHQRAEGNLSYLDFIRVVEQLWKTGHPDVPFFASSPARQAHYPSITYSLMNRRTHPNEPKPRLREEINTGSSVVDEDGTVVLKNQGIIVQGWRFVSIVKFTVHDEVQPNGAQTVEELIEVFEDFMIEHQYVFKQLGVSELTYNARLDDDEENRDAEDIVKRAITYRLTTEKVFVTEIDKLLEMAASVRVAQNFTNEATPQLVNPYEPFYEEVLADPTLTMTRGVFERFSIIDDQQTPE